MCLAIYKPKDKRVRKGDMELAFMSNPDGAGIAYSAGGRVHIRKGFFEFEDFWKAYKKRENLACLIHFRYTTHGATNKTNCHPFRLSEGCAMIHNGIIPDMDTDSKTSDTRAFVRDMVKPAYKQNYKFIYSDYGKRMMSGLIGNSKLVFLNRRGKAVIIGEEMGHWHKGVWYSNDTYKRLRGCTTKSLRSMRPASSIPLPKGKVKTATAEDVLGTWIPKSEREIYEEEEDQLEIELDDQYEEEQKRQAEEYAKRRYKGFSIVDEAEGLLE